MIIIEVDFCKNSKKCRFIRSERQKQCNSKTLLNIIDAGWNFIIKFLSIQILSFNKITL